uniref:uracil-DNA glycosylase n=1 Tax=Sphingomonas bacterium TaxID=1895847 RepID=UPI0026048B44|nr:uracil-DNA glycosylase [Sphingomonas bacterium]
MLALPHIEPLTKFVESLRVRNDAEYPFFDPMDGGVDATLLFLFEKPGPKTAGSLGSGFISRDNNDSTAEATSRFMKQAGIARHDAVIWNVVPGWNGTRKITEIELSLGIKDFTRLLGLLPKIRAVVLVGKKAARVRHILGDLPVYSSAHPSPVARAAWREQWDRIPLEWAAAADAVGIGQSVGLP